MRTMWVLAMFDLPVDTKVARRHYRQFRDALLCDGFMMLQYSVYGRPCPSEENASLHMARVEEALPPNGQIRILTLTDMQFSRMKIFYGNAPATAEKQPQQLSFF
jgi:CRISPR-associated protein Cas2